MNFERWLTLMTSWGITDNQKTYESLVAAYAENGRHYHTQEHVQHCLRHLDACVSEAKHPREIELALWFHDAVYKPLSNSNELESAEWGSKFLSENAADSNAADRVHRLIMVTEHNAPTQSKDESILVDIDLSVLGANPANYEVFEQAIRKEYRVVPRFVYRKKRSEILRGFLVRPRIYINEPFFTKYETQARENLSKAILKLDGKT